MCTRDTFVTLLALLVGLFLVAPATLVAQKVIKVKVESKGRSAIEVEVRETDTVESLKKKIAERLNVASRKVVVEFQGKTRNNSETVKDLGLKTGDAIKIIDPDYLPKDEKSRSIKITVERKGKQPIQITVDSADTVEALKKKVANQWKLDARKITVLHSGSKRKDYETIKDIGISSGDKISIIDEN